MSSIRKRFLAILLAAMLVCVGFAGTSVSAESTGKQLTVVPNTDVQPFIRQLLPKSLFGSGGPFTVHVQVKTDDFQKTNVDGAFFLNLWDDRLVEGESVVTLFNYDKKTDWIDVKMTSNVESYNAGLKAGDPITFDNVKGMWINGKLEDYILLDMGMIFAKGSVTFRNFEVTNAAGEVVYSWATEPDLEGISNLSEIENPQPIITTASFGDWSGQVLVSDADDTPPTVSTTAPPVYEDPGPGDSTTGATEAPTGGGDTTTTNPASEDPVATTDPASDVSADDSSDVSDSSSRDTSADSSAAAVGGELGDDDEGSFPIWIPIVIVVGVIVVAGVVLLVLWKLNKLPWVKKEQG